MRDLNGWLDRLFGVRKRVRLRYQVLVVRCRIGVHDEYGSLTGMCRRQFESIRGFVEFWNRIRPDRTDQTDHALEVQSPRGDQAVELWLGAEMEQEANRKVRRSEVVIELAGRERRQVLG